MKSGYNLMEFLRHPKRLIRPAQAQVSCDLVHGMRQAHDSVFGCRNKLPLEARSKLETLLLSSSTVYRATPAYTTTQRVCMAWLCAPLPPEVRARNSAVRPTPRTACLPCAGGQSASGMVSRSALSEHSFAPPTPHAALLHVSTYVPVFSTY